jgi:hypothetical protein
VGTSNKVEKPKSPFNFKEKVQIMTMMFGIPSNKIYEVKNPYAPTEIIKKFDENVYNKYNTWYSYDIRLTRKINRFINSFDYTLLGDDIYKIWLWFNL